MPSSFEVSPDDLLAAAARVESIRAQIHPGSLPVGFAPAGADGASAAIATRISAQAAAAVNGLWGVWSELGKIADTLRANAHGYQSQDDANRSRLSGGSGGAQAASTPSVPQPASVAEPMVFVGPASATPEEISALIRAGAGESSPEQFGQRWTAHAAVVDAAVTDLAGVRGGLSASWRGDAHDRAASSFSAAEAALSSQHGKVSQVGSSSSTHALDYKQTVGGIPHPSKFAGWWQDYDSAAAAEAQQPGQHMDAVIAAQQQLNNGWTQTTEAYTPYAVDPQTGDLIDPATGQPIPGTADLAAALEEGEGDAEGEGLDDSMTSQAGQMLTGLLGGAVSAATGAVGALTQPMQQGFQAATQAFSQAAKGMGQQDGGLGAGDLEGLSDTDFGGGGGSGGGGSGGGGESTGPAAFTGGMVGTASAPPPASGQGALRSVATPSSPSSGMGMGGMGAPMVGGPGAGGAAAGGAKATADGKKLLAPRQANTQRVIGETSAARISDKKAARERVMAEAKEAKEAAQKDGEP
ncbi:PE domain-containing protein [Mycobacteroides abscessus]|uniref:PE domain-containing protein n=1 Tax=Mycobacteroides abscessus TaxID=36809 RepID=UPI0009A6738E|nr:PE domain-containing protein [Mycobacteroides abscessus]